MSATKENFTKHYKGFDASLFISLFEYGFIYSYTDPLSNGDLRVWCRNGGENNFGWADFNKDLDFWKEFSWVHGSDQRYFMEFLGTSMEDFNKWPLENKIGAAINYFGAENVCGTNYYPTVIRESDWEDGIDFRDKDREREIRQANGE